MGYEGKNMTIVTSIAYAVMWAVSSLWGIVEIAPGLKKKKLRLHLMALVILTVMVYFYDGAKFSHVMAFEMILMLMLMILYRLSSFITAITAVLLYTGQMLAAIIASNISLFVLKDIFDFRVLFRYENLYVLLLFYVVFTGVINYYHLLMRLFKNIVNINNRIQLLIVLSNMAVFILFLVYQKYTFANLASVLRSGTFTELVSVNQINHYMMYSYIGITLMALIVVLLINRVLIVDNNLERYKYKAEIDPMTGVLSRDAGINALKTEIQRARHHHEQLTIAYVDVNDLKVVNDKFGHKEGDRLLRYITEIIQSNLRDLDMIARLGGDEFMIIYKKCSEEQAKRVWKRIDDEFVQINQTQNLSYQVSASAGFTQFDPNKHRTVSALLHEADSLMYQHKKNSKQRHKSRT